MLERRERRHSWGRVVVEPQRIRIEGVHREYVAVGAIAGGGSGSEVGGLARIAAQMESRTVQHEVGCSGTRLQVGHGRRDVKNCPVPPARGGRGIRVKAGQHEARRVLGETVPREIRGKGSGLGGRRLGHGRAVGENAR